VGPDPLRTTDPQLRVEGLSKHFGGLVAVDRVSLGLHRGEVLGLVGDNGAGKSTLIKMIAGVYAPDEGEIWFRGKPMLASSPREARDAGIETIYQDLALAENMNAGDNIFMGREPTSRFLGFLRFVNRRQMAHDSEHILDRLDIRLPAPSEKIRNLSGGQRQAVAIARAIFWNASLVIMDEPTAALGVPEQRKVYELVRALRTEGVPVIIISHNLGDVFAVADRIVVMRRGRTVGDLLATATTPEEVVGLMVGAGEVVGRNVD
jgi:ABC-type sugar transport system ATPase subunit